MDNNDLPEITVESFSLSQLRPNPMELNEIVASEQTDATANVKPAQPLSWWQGVVEKFWLVSKFIGPGHVIAVGYIDPGNWATDLSGGSEFGYTLLNVIFLSSLVAIFVQVLALRLGIVSQRDLAQHCRSAYPRWVCYLLFVFAEIAIIATDLAEVIGCAIALNLLFGLPLWAGVLITAGDVVFILFGLQKYVTLLELLIAALVTTVMACFIYLLSQSAPINVLDVTLGFAPSANEFSSAAIFVGIGIMGATIMPHNIYLHSSLAKEHSIEQPTDMALKWSTIDTISTLSIAFFVNAAILIVSAIHFYETGHTEVASLQDAYSLLQISVSPAFATIFAVGLLCSGQSATITGTLAGQVVTEGFLSVQVAAWLQRLVTRLIAIMPAAVVAAAVGEASLNMLLIVSQVVLSMQLPFAIFPLIQFTSSSDIMGRHANHWIVKWLLYSLALFIAALNVYLLVETAICPTC